MAVLSREQVEKLKKLNKCDGYLGGKNVEILIETIEHLQHESDRRELSHEKARHEVELERDRLKAFKPFCFDGKDKCAYMAIGEGGEPTETCKNCHWCEQGYEALGVEAE